MHPRPTTLLACSLSLVAAACAGGSADSEATSGGEGGNVGFGGAQDIGQFRDILERGEIPGPSTLDANGFFGEHHLELPPPDCGQPLCLHGMLSVDRSWLTGDYQSTLEIAINTPADPSALERKPLNMVVVVDTSGSMGLDQRMTYVKQGLGLLIDELEVGDRLALVTYDSEATVLADLGADTPAETLHALVETLTPSGATNIHDGLETGFLLLAENIDSERQNRLILLSDGLATAGNTSDEAIIAMAEAFIADGIGLTTIGVGDDFNVELMRGLSERGAGNFYYVESPAAVTEVFTEELGYFIEPLALDVAIAVETAPSYEVGEVLGTRLWQAEGSSGSMYVPAVFLASREDSEPGEYGRRGGGSALFLDMRPRAGEFDEPTRVAAVTLQYRVPGVVEPYEQRVIVNSEYRSEVPEGGYYSHEQMPKSYAMYNIFLGLREAARGAESDYGCALSTLEAIEREATAWNGVNEDADVAADLELVGSFASNLVEHGATRSACYDGTGEYPEDLPYGDDHHHAGIYACSVGGARGAAGSGALLVLAAVLASGRRRRSQVRFRTSWR